MTTHLEEDISLEQRANQEMFATSQKAKVTIKTAVLRKAVQKIAPMIDAKNSLPILTGLYFNVATNIITLRGANSNFYAEGFIDKEDYVLEGQNSGLVIPAKKFADLIAKLSGPNTTLEFDGTEVTVKSKGAKVKLSAMHIDEFPSFPTVKDGSSFEIPAGALQNMYTNTIYAVSKKEETPILTGICHDIKEGQFRCIATDRHRLSQICFEQKVEVADARKVIPGSTVIELMKHLKDSVMVNVSMDDAHIIYKMEKTSIYSRVLEGRYPETDVLLAPEYKTTITLNTADMLAAFRRSGLFTNESGECKTTFLVSTGDQQLRVLSVKSEEGQLQEDMVMSDAKGDFLSITCNTKYLIELFSRLPLEGQVDLKFNGNTPYVVKQRGAIDGTHFIVVPVKDLNDKINEITGFNPMIAEDDPFAERASKYAEAAAEASGIKEDAA